MSTVAGSLRAPAGVSISTTNSLPRHVMFAGTLDEMSSLVAVLRATADEMEANIAVRAELESIEPNAGLIAVQTGTFEVEA